MKKIMAADLFCGAGGTSTGLLEAARALGFDVELIAVNHWDVAIATHKNNHPDVTHFDSDLEKIDPLAMVPAGKLDLLVASPECTHFSNARGGMPMNKQSRASVKWILKWCSKLDVADVLIENVKEFTGWGPLHRICTCGLGAKSVKKHAKGCLCHRPIKSRKGEYFRRFISKMESLGYSVQWRTLIAANYGDPTTRERLFIQARKNAPVRWPEPTHSKNGGQDLFNHYEKWVPASVVIDKKLKGQSIFKRKKPLVPNTMKRIMAGLVKCSGLPFVIGQQSGATPRVISEPMPTVSGAGAISFVEPFILPLEGFYKGNAARSLDEPVPTITSRGGGYLVEPSLISVDGPERQGYETQRIDEPWNGDLEENRIALIQPFLIPFYSENGDQAPRVHPVDEPIPTIPSSSKFGLVQPFIIPVNHGDDERSYSVEDPMPTITSVDAWALVEPKPFMVVLNGTSEDKLKTSHRSIEEPVPSLVGSGHVGLAEPFLVEYYGTSKASSIHEPLPTQGGRDRFGLVEPLIFKGSDGKLYMLDILFRMLQPRELAAAMSFPKDYHFSGNREQVVKQIGNAVPVKLAAALCGAIIQTSSRFGQGD